MKHFPDKRSFAAWTGAAAGNHESAGKKKIKMLTWQSIANRLAWAIDLILGGEPYRELGYMRGDPHEQKVQKLVNQLRVLGVDIKTINHQMIVSTRKITVEKTGIILDEM